MVCIVENCKMCSDYQCEEIGDSDYGAVYSETPSCQKYKDYNDDTDEFIQGFDYEKERECCSIDFFKVMEEDEELSKMFDDEMNRTDDCDDTYLYFKEKYKLAKLKFRRWYIEDNKMRIVRKDYHKENENSK